MLSIKAIEDGSRITGPEKKTQQLVYKFVLLTNAQWKSQPTLTSILDVTGRNIKVAWSELHFVMRL